MDLFPIRKILIALEKEISSIEFEKIISSHSKLKKEVLEKLDCLYEYQGDQLILDTAEKVSHFIYSDDIIEGKGWITFHDGQKLRFHILPKKAYYEGEAVQKILHKILGRLPKKQGSFIFKSTWFGVKIVWEDQNLAFSSFHFKKEVVREYSGNSFFLIDFFYSIIFFLFLISLYFLLGKNIFLFILGLVLILALKWLGNKIKMKRFYKSICQK